MGKSVRAPDSLGHKHSGDFDYRASLWVIWVWVGYTLGGKHWLAVKGSSHGGQVQTSHTAEGEALQDRTGPEVASCTGNDNLTRWHICNYHPWLSLSIAWAFHTNHHTFSVTQQVFLYGIVVTKGNQGSSSRVWRENCSVRPPASEPADLSTYQNPYFTLNFISKSDFHHSLFAL